MDLSRQDHRLLGCRCRPRTLPAGDSAGGPGRGPASGDHHRVWRGCGPRPPASPRQSARPAPSAGSAARPAAVSSEVILHFLSKLDGYLIIHLGFENVHCRRKRESSGFPHVRHLTSIMKVPKLYCLWSLISTSPARGHHQGEGRIARC